MSARSATRSTPASRRSSTPVVASPASRSGTPRRRHSRRSSFTCRAGPRSRAEAGASCMWEPTRTRPENEEASMFEAVDGLVTEHAELEQKLAEPGLHSDQALAKRLNQRYAELSAILRAYDEWNRLGDDVEAAHELAGEDPTFAEEADALTVRRGAGGGGRRHPLVPPGAARPQGAPLGVKSPRSGCGPCWSRVTPPTPRTRCWRSSPVRAARSPRCSPATCCGCTPATPSAVAGRPSSSTRPSPTSGGSSPSPWR